MTVMTQLASLTENMAVEVEEQQDDNVRLLMEVASDRGVMIRLHPDGSYVSVGTVPDRHYPEIHPNCYAPADLQDVHPLKGGGSGAAVFHGRSPELGAIVMKHGGAKDSREVFSLVTIQQELLKRGQQQDTEAAEYMKAKIPEFVMAYLSPYHVRDRQQELWSTLRQVSSTSTLRQVSSNNKVIPSEELLRRSLELKKRSRESLLVVKDEKGSRLFSIASAAELQLVVSFKEIEVHIPGLQPDGTVTGVVDTLMRLGDKLAKAQDDHNWKVTLAQKKIGGEHAQNCNGALVHTRGELKGELLTMLITQFTQVMRNLEKLTTSKERGSIESVRRELAALQKSRDVTKVSENLDSFVGAAIRKNYMPYTGRFAKLRELGELFRSYGSNDDFFLSEREEIPAKLLGRILERGASPHKVFWQPPSCRTALDSMEDQWLEILNHAASLDGPSATSRIWTCGLTDAGLHNTFLSTERGLELFDLGEPRLVTQPAFLTKFLMSFFHTLGMEEENNGKTAGSSWVNRFCVVNGRAALTNETKTKMAYTYKAYSAASDHFVKELFHGDERVRCLLVKYVVLQLLSDASFCLDRWYVKGGGTERYGERVDMGIDKWLWRSLWDIYIASHVYAQLVDPRLVPGNRFESAISWWVEHIH